MPDSSVGRAGMSIQHISMRKHNAQKKAGLCRWMHSPAFLRLFMLFDYFFVGGVLFQSFRHSGHLGQISDENHAA